MQEDLKTFEDIFRARGLYLESVDNCIQIPHFERHTFVLWNWVWKDFENKTRRLRLPYRSIDFFNRFAASTESKLCQTYHYLAKSSAFALFLLFA